MNKALKNKRFVIYSLLALLIIIISFFVVRAIIDSSSKINLDQDGYLLISKNNDPYKTYINVKKISVDQSAKDTMQVWAKGIPPQSDVSKNGFDTIISQFAIDCGQKKLSIIQFNTYLNSDLVDSTPYHDYTYNFESPMPNSRGEVILNYVCNGQLQKDHKASQTFWQNLF